MTARGLTELMTTQRHLHTGVSSAEESHQFESNRSKQGCVGQSFYVLYGKVQIRAEIREQLGNNLGFYVFHTLKLHGPCWLRCYWALGDGSDPLSLFPGDSKPSWDKAQGTEQIFFAS